MGRELRQAARRLLRAPAFTLTAVLTLGLAIGANAAIFAVVERVVLNPLPYPESDRLIQVDHGAQALGVPSGLGITPGLYFHYSERARSLDGIAMYDTSDATLTGGGDPERIRVTQASPSLGSVMRVPPALGRWFTTEEGVPGAARVAVISHGLWMRRFGRDPSILGRSMTLDGLPTEVIGVMPPSYAFPEPRVEAWIAAQTTRALGFGTFGQDAVARLRAGRTAADARAELAGLLDDVLPSFPGDPLAVGMVQSRLLLNITTLKEATVGAVARALWILLASVAIVLLVACANVANLFLVRSETRQREIAVRRAVGAGGRGITRYFLAESTLLSIAGGLAGLAVASVAVRLLVANGPATLPRLAEIRLDSTALLVTFALTMLAALAFGAVPLLHRVPLSASLQEGGRGNTASRSRHRARHLLMGAQVALALVLVVSSGLMVRSFQKLRAVDPGFNAASALTFGIGLPEREYRTRAAAVAAHQAILDRLSALPGVTDASAVSCLPLAGGCSGNTLQVEGRTLPRGTVPPLALFRAVGPAYFETMGIRLLRGRTVTRDEIDRGEPVVVVSKALADQFFPTDDPIGKRVASNLPPGRLDEAVPARAWLTIVGTVADTPINALGEPYAVPHLYMPMSIASGPDTPPLVGPNVTLMRYVVRSTTPPPALLPFVRQAIDGIDAKLPIAEVRTLQEIIDGASSQMAFTMVLLAIAAAVALMLGMVGIYGVMSYVVSQRTAEIGVRLALGAAPGGVARMIVRQGGTVACAGIIAGIGAALAGGRLIESMLFGVSPRDPAVFGATALALLGVALFACWVPARRAARLNPLLALRTD